MKRSSAGSNSVRLGLLHLEQTGRPKNPDGLKWIAKHLGRPLVDLEDKEAVRALLDVRA